MAASLERVLDRDVRFVDVEPADLAASLTGVLHPWQVEELLEDRAHYRRGVSSKLLAESGRDIPEERDLSRLSSHLEEGPCL